MIRLNTPLTPQVLSGLHTGDSVLLSGVIYTARDAAHKRLTWLIQQGHDLPFPLRNATIYYAGPCPAGPGQVIGSCGPTTSGRMDSYAPILMDHGLTAMIGKGPRDARVVDAIRRNCGVYFATIGGAGALIASTIREAEIIAFEDLGTEAIRRLVVEDFPMLVAIDSQGNDLYQSGPACYRMS